LVIKSGSMIGYFIADPQHSYFQSPVFTQVLNYIQTNPKGCKMSEKNNKLRLIYSNVDNINYAYSRISEIIKVHELKD